MSDTKISGLTAITGASLATGDLLVTVDVSDTTMAATGTDKKTTFADLDSRTKTLTNATFDTAGSGNVFKINTTAISDITGTGKAVLDTAPQISTIELGAASDTTISRSSAGVVAVEGVVIPSISSTNTLTNKRITKRAPAITQSATPAINTDVTDVAHITALAQAITSMTSSLTGTPVEGDTLRIDITDNGTARAITWGASFEASGTVALPTTTVLGVRLDVGFVWNTVTSKWRCVATA